jgi:hypothetical protein
MSAAARPPQAAGSGPLPCAHDLCGCTTAKNASEAKREGRLYCSAACADPGARTLETCPCGHSGCKREGRHVRRPGEPPKDGTPPPPPYVLV